MLALAQTSRSLLRRSLPRQVAARGLVSETLNIMKKSNIQAKMCARTRTIFSLCAFPSERVSVVFFRARAGSASC